MHSRAWLHVAPPKHPVAFAPDFPNEFAVSFLMRQPLRPDVLADIAKRLLVERSLLVTHLAAEIDDPHVSRSARDVQSVEPGFQDVRVRATIWVGGSQKPLPREVTWYVERATFGIAHEGDPQVLRQALCQRQIDCGRAASAREIAVNLRNTLAVEMHG
jgi:hypothetical protein